MTTGQLSIPFIKGQGAENDFLLLPDPDGQLDLTESMIQAMCDRRRGIGADGILRVVRTKAVKEDLGDQLSAEWFMDYRNSDGSVAEMCGNGVRVFARYLTTAGLVSGREFSLATRAGLKKVRLGKDGQITVDLGVPTLLDAAPNVVGQPATAISMGNPHVVVWYGDSAGDLTRLAELDLSQPPLVQPALPEGQNVEFVVRHGHRELSMRVHERGVGETKSCGTGICAVAVATVMHVGEGRGEAWTVHTPGGLLQVEWTFDGGVLLTGPAVLVADGEFRQKWLDTL